MTTLQDNINETSEDIAGMVRRLRAFRKEKGMSMRELAERVGTSQQQIDRLEKGKRRLTVSWLHKISEALECEMVDFLPTHVSKRDVSMMGRAKVVGKLGYNQRVDWLEAPQVYSAMFTRPLCDFSKRWFGVVIREQNNLGFSLGTELIFAEVDNVITLIHEGWLMDDSIILVEIKLDEGAYYRMGLFRELKDVGRTKAILIKSLRNEI